MEGLEEELTCPVCLELFVCPLQLPCSHNLCHRCAEVFFQTDTSKSTKSDGEGKACSSPIAHAPGPDNQADTFLCPKCREDVPLDARGLDGLRKNSLLQNIVESYKKMKSTSDPAMLEVPCQLCKPDRPKMAFRSCLDCRASYCEECLAVTHPEHPPFSEHKIADPRYSFEDPSQTVMCPDHPSKPVEMYCVQDQTPVCLLCEKVGRHKQHNMAALEEVFSQRRAELQAWVDCLEEWLTDAEDQLIDLGERRDYIEQSAATLKDAIEQECEALHEIIRQRAAEMNRQVSLLSEKDVARVQFEINELIDDMQQSRTSIAYAKVALKETDHGCFLQYGDLMKLILYRIITFDGFIDPDRIECEVENLKVDLSKKKEQLKTIDFGAPPEAPVILHDECRTTVDEAYIKWQRSNDVKGYHVGYKMQNAYMVATVQGDSFTAKHLASGTTYTFVVSARNKTGYSSDSSVRLVTKPEPPPVVDSIRSENSAMCPACGHENVVITRQSKYPSPFTFQLSPYICGIGLKLLDGYTRVQYCTVPSEDPDYSNSRPKWHRFCSPDGGRTVLGNKSVSSGKHYWEVTVQSTDYNIGVAYQDIPSDRPLFETPSSWAFECFSTGRYDLAHNGEVYRERYYNPKPRKIGVLLDYDNCRLSFFNAETNEHLGTLFKWYYTQPLYPAFTLWSGELTIHTGLSCPY